MILVRDVFRLKFGKARDALAVWKEMAEQGVQAGVFRPMHPIAAYFTLIAPIVFYTAAAPIRKELAEARLLDISALSPASFIAHVQDTMRRAFAPEPAQQRRSKP